MKTPKPQPLPGVRAWARESKYGKLDPWAFNCKYEQNYVRVRIIKESELKRLLRGKK